MAIGDEWDALDAWMAGDDDAPPEASTIDLGEPPTLAAQADADRALRSLRRLDRQADDVNEVVAAETARLKAWAEDRMHGLNRRRSWIERSLEGFMRAHNETTGTLTLTLPNGVVALRKPGQPTVVADDSVAQDGAAVNLIDKGHKELVRVTYDLDRNAIKAVAKPGTRIDKPEVDIPDGADAYEAVTNDGEVLPGVVFIVQGERKFSAKPNTGSGR